VTYVKLYICLGFLTVGMILYIMVEIFDRRHKKKGFNLN
jgi:hypothetical protein